MRDGMFGGIDRLPMLGRWHQRSGHAIVRCGRTLFTSVGRVGRMQEDAYVQELGDDGC